MIIYLARHGDYVNGNDDFTRVLSARGRAEISAMAEELKNRGVHIRATLHSGKIRAQQTAEILADALMTSSVISMVDGLTPNDDPAEFETEHFPNLVNSSLIVGHLPFMGLMVSLLVTGDAERQPEAFEAGTVVCMEKAENGKWTRNWALHPSQLNK